MARLIDFLETHWLALALFLVAGVLRPTFEPNRRVDIALDSLAQIA